MSMPPLPPPLEALRTRPFSFYPAVLNVEHNEWLFRKATWSEILVYNPKSDFEVWIPRRLIGEISPVDDPVIIVGLLKELEFKAGAVWPYQRRVIQMPVAVGQNVPSPALEREEPAPVIGIRVERSTETRILRLIGGTIVVGIVAYFGIVNLYRESVFRQRVVYRFTDDSFQQLTSRDDYYAVVQKLGPPAEDRWQSETGTLQCRALSYPQRHFIVVLMGTDRRNATYIGAMSEQWAMLHSTSGATAAMLRNMKKF